MQSQVTGVDYLACGRLYPERTGAGYGVVHRPEADSQAAYVHFGVARFQRCAVQATGGVAAFPKCCGFRVNSTTAEHAVETLLGRYAAVVPGSDEAVSQFARHGVADLTAPRVLQGFVDGRACQTGVDGNVLPQVGQVAAVVKEGVGIRALLARLRRGTRGAQQIAPRLLGIRSRRGIGFSKAAGCPARATRKSQR